MRGKKCLLSLLLCLALLSGCGGAGTGGESSSQPPSAPEISAPSVSDPETGGGEEDAGSAEPQPEQYPEAMPEDFELAVEDVPELVPDLLGIRELIYEEEPLFASQEEVAVYALWNLLWGRTEFECRLTRELAPSDGAGHVVLDSACTAAMSYYLFSAYHTWDMYIQEDGDPDSVFARVELRYEHPEWDLEARAEALEYVMKNPAPIGGFASYESEMEYAREIHDYVACQVTYDPMGYDPNDMLYSSRYDSLQEAYNLCRRPTTCWERDRRRRSAPPTPGPSPLSPTTPASTVPGCGETRRRRAATHGT